MADELFEDMIGDVLDESEEHLTSLSDNLLWLDEWVGSCADGERCSDDLITELFRSAHSVKGLSAMVGLTDINDLTHHIENVFDAVRNDELILNSDVVESVFRAVDRLGQMVEGVRTGDDKQEPAADVVQELLQILTSAGVERVNHSSPDGSPTEPTEVKEAGDLPTDGGPKSAADVFEGVEDDFDASSKYAQMFFDESTEMLDSLAELLLLSEESGSTQSSEELLVLAHRFKGSAASVGFLRPAQLAHHMEDTLQELRNGGQPVPTELANSLFKCGDALREYIEVAKTGERPADDFPALVSELTALDLGPMESRPEPTADSDSPGSMETSRNGIQADFRAKAAELAEGENHVLGQVQFQQGLPLAGLKACLLHNRVSNISDVFHSEPPLEGLEDQDDLQTYAFAILGDTAEEEVRTAVDLDGILRVDVESVVASSTEAVQGSHRPETQDAPLLDMDPLPQPRDDAQASAPANVEKRRIEDQSSKQQAPRTESKATETLRVDIERLDHMMNLAGQLVINKARFSEVGQRLKHLLSSKQTAQAISDTLHLFKKVRDEVESGNARLDFESLRSQVRRMEGNLEKVQRDISKLVESRSGVVDLFEAIHQLDRVAGGIQKSVMDTRMVPVGPLFARFKRVIRDITRGNGKNVVLEIQGEKTELDKRMIDELGDPLIHMVRNSADHGIESPEERVAANKPPQGTIKLNAFHSGNSIVVQITDDGRGLDPDVIRDKAIERGILAAADADKMTQHQIFQLIWEPGFSTAKQITEISGRGMGMDIVRSKIEDLNGTAELDSTPGVGTTVTVKLPLTLAILPSLLAMIDGDAFALPIESVLEIVQLKQSELATVHGKLTATVRGRVISVIELRETLTWHQPVEPVDNADSIVTLVVLGSGGRELGLRVDELLGEEDVVIKSIAENYRNVEGVAGASILGDGRVALILDVAGIVDLTSRGTLDLVAV